MPRDDDYEQVEVFVDKLVRQTDKAALCDIDGDEIWIPWSQIGDGSGIEKDGDSGTIYIPRWLAEEHDLA
jgi:hypothetical protein